MRNPGTMCSTAPSPVPARCPLLRLAPEKPLAQLPGEVLASPSGILDGLHALVSGRQGAELPHGKAVTASTSQ